MSNSITVSSEFDFKGKKLSPSMVIDLDQHIKTNGYHESLYSMLASSNEIGLYSYEYEILLSTDLIFSNATGLAENFLTNGEFDFAGFQQALRNQSLDGILSEIAHKHLSIADLSSQPNLRKALLEAYQCGKKSGRK